MSHRNSNREHVIDSGSESEDSMSENNNNNSKKNVASIINPNSTGTINSGGNVSVSWSRITPDNTSTSSTLPIHTERSPLLDRSTLSSSGGNNNNNNTNNSSMLLSVDSSSTTFLPTTSYNTYAAMPSPLLTQSPGSPGYQSIINTNETNSGGIKQSQTYLQPPAKSVSFATPSSSSSSSSPLPPSPSPAPSPGPDDQISCIVSMEGYVSSTLLEIRYWVVCVLSCFSLWLLFQWFPEWEIAWRYRRCSLRDASHIWVVPAVHRSEFVPVQSLQLDDEAVSAHKRKSSKAGRLFIFRHQRYFYSNNDDTFISHYSDTIATTRTTVMTGTDEDDSITLLLNEKHTSVANVTNEQLIKRIDTGLLSQQVNDNVSLYGSNRLAVEIPSLGAVLVAEVVSPFWVFQAFTVILWMFFERYIVFAICIFIMAVVAIADTVIDTRARIKEVATLAAFECNVTVKRNGKFQIISSTQLVPGDIVQLNIGTLPCDLTLLQGGAVMNESMLTGESVPVIKTSLALHHSSDHAHDAVAVAGAAAPSSSTLLGATQVLQLKPSQPGESVLALVIRTGFSTNKGSLILSILYPQPSTFKFARQSYFFTGVLGIVALMGFFVSWYLLSLQNVTTRTIVIRGLDLVTIIIPPCLPLALTVSTSFALVWLRKENIFCISPSRINLAGKIRVMCFDKTGTLTEDSLKFKGLLPGPNVNTIASQQQLSVHSVHQQQQSKLKEFGTFQVYDIKQSIAASKGFNSPSRLSSSSSSTSASVSINSRAFTEESKMAPQPGPVDLDGSHAVPLSLDMRIAMACCQSLALLDQPLVEDASGNNSSRSNTGMNLVGDPLDQEMFNISGAHLQDSGAMPVGFKQIVRIPAFGNTSSSSSPSSRQLQHVFGLRQTFEFSSQLQRMSVIVSELGNEINGNILSSESSPSSSSSSSSSVHWAFVKGSPEAIALLCKPDTMPYNYAAVLASLAHQGYRVIAIGRKPLKSLPSSNITLSNLRLEIECNLDFLGLIVLENSVKPESAPTMRILRSAAIRLVMVSGDNVLTAITAARECQLLASGVRVFQGILIPVSESIHPSGQIIQWIDTDDQRYKLEYNTWKLICEDGPAASPLASPLPSPRPNASTPLPTDLNSEAALSTSQRPVPFELAITGPVYRWLKQYGSENESFKSSSSPSYSSSSSSSSSSPTPALSVGTPFERAILNAQVFARMGPSDKTSLIATFQEMGLYTGMIGDGANDCGSLKTAHVGISLSASEASIAAPFTYRKNNISCVPILLSEGRAALITTFQLFKFMTMYSVIQPTAVIMSYAVGSVIGNWQYLYADLLLTFPLTILMGATRANRELSVKRPSGDLLSAVNLFNVGIHWILVILFQIWAYEEIIHDPSYVPLPNPTHGPYSYVATGMAVFTNFQYIIMAILFALGRPWKSWIWTNWMLTIWCIAGFIVSLILLLTDWPMLWLTWDILPLSNHLRFTLLWVMIFYACSATVFELLFYPGFLRLYKRYWSGYQQQLCFQRWKPQAGSKSKVWHRNRAEFELQARKGKEKMK